MENEFLLCALTGSGRQPGKRRIFPFQMGETAMRNTQSGMSSFGAIIVIAIAGAAAYFVYQGSFGGGEAPNCKSAFASCMQACRRNSTDEPTAQACQAACTREQTSCERATN